MVVDLAGVSVGSVSSATLTVTTTGLGVGLGGAGGRSSAAVAWARAGAPFTGAAESAPVVLGRGRRFSSVSAARLGAATTQAAWARMQAQQEAWRASPWGCGGAGSWRQATFPGGSATGNAAAGLIVGLSWGWRRGSDPEIQAFGSVGSADPDGVGFDLLDAERGDGVALGQDLVIDDGELRAALAPDAAEGQDLGGARAFHLGDGGDKVWNGSRWGRSIQLGYCESTMASSMGFSGSRLLPGAPGDADTANAVDAAGPAVGAGAPADGRSRTVAEAVRVGATRRENRLPANDQTTVAIAATNRMPTTMFLFRSCFSWRRRGLGLVLRPQFHSCGRETGT